MELIVTHLCRSLEIDAVGDSSKLLGQDGDGGNDRADRDGSLGAPLRRWPDRPIARRLEPAANRRRRPYRAGVRR